MSAPRILITGATGYVGGRLLQRLEAEGLPLRCLARRPENLRSRVGPHTEVVAGDLVEGTGLASALAGIEVAFYFVHSMGATEGFESEDRRAAEHFGAAAKAAGLGRIIFLGGLGQDEADLSPHLRSRHEVGTILRASGVPVLEFRASIVLGSGSLSFELIRALVERLPLMITPRWVSVLAQPIAIENLLDYLSEAIKLPLPESRIVEIGGADQMTYADLMRRYARLRGLRVKMIPVPFLTPHLSSLWLGLITPVYARVGRKLIDSIRHPTLVQDPGPGQAFSVRPMGVDQAIQRAMVQEDQAFAATRWTDALSSAGPLRTWGGVRFGTRLVDARSLEIQAPTDKVFPVMVRIGGGTGWYAWNGLWRLRGFIDQLMGGVGFRRGRAHPEFLRVGDAVDFWRVEAVEPGRRLRLIAEMKLPGRAWLEFDVSEAGAGSRLTQTAIFDPAGFWGLAYWYVLYPIHQVVFAAMLRGMAKAALATPQARP